MLRPFLLDLNRQNPWGLHLVIGENDSVSSAEIKIPLMKSSFLLFLAGFILLSASCTEEMREQLEAQPTAFGPLNQLVVVADSSLWSSAVGDTFDYYFASAYPILPQPEPIFDIKFFTPAQLMNVKERRELRTYIFLADLKDKNSAMTRMMQEDMGQEKISEVIRDKGFKVTIGKDKWAKGQLLVYMAGSSREALIESIKRQYSSVIQQIRKEDHGRIDAGVYLGGLNETLRDEIRLNLGVDLRVPNDYFKAMYDPEKKVMWIRKETEDLSSNIMIQVLPYTDKAQLSKAGIKAIRDELGKYVASDIPNTYMLTNDVDLPMLSYVGTYQNYYSVEARGIWEMQNDYMGGPFYSLLVLNPNDNKLYYFDGFVHAPGKDKREFMQQLEHVMRTAKL